MMNPVTIPVCQDDTVAEGEPLREQLDQIVNTPAVGYRLRLLVREGESRIAEQGFDPVAGTVDGAFGQSEGFSPSRSLERIRYAHPVVFPITLFELDVTHVTVDLGDIPTEVEPDAARLLAKLSPRAVAKVLFTIREWLSEGVPAEHVAVTTVTEPDTPDWTEVVFEVKVATDSTNALALWDSLAARLDDAKRELSPTERDALNRHVGVHLTW